MKCDWMRYMNKGEGMPIIRKRKTLAPQGACDSLQISGQQKK